MNDKPALVIGDLMRDILVHPEGPIRKGSDVTASILISPGGSAGNQAAWLSASGAQVALLARVGADDLDMLTAELATFGIASALVPDQTAPSGRLICIVEPDGERSFLTDRGACKNLCVDDAAALDLSLYSHICVSGYLFFSETGRALGQYLIAEGTRLNVPTMLDPASAGFIADVGVDTFLELTKGATYLFPNQEEAALLASTDDVAQQISMLSQFYGHVIAKRDAEGVFTTEQGELFHVTAPRSDVIDTTGAGDAFLGGFVAAQKRGESLQSALRAGVVAGSGACAISGGRPQLD